MLVADRAPPFIPVLSLFDVFRAKAVSTVRAAFVAPPVTIRVGAFRAFRHVVSKR